jgi:release factor glutamine methyltransferase
VLNRLGFATAALDAKLLTAHALGLDALALAIREGDPVSAADVEKVAQVLQRRLTGESVSRIQGFREFYGLPFALSAATLEPRPDTELLVDLALHQLPEGGSVLDLGTGTGCIPIAILANKQAATGTAVDINAGALAIAHENAIRNGVSDRLTFVEGSWFSMLEAGQAFDLIVSNPPYISSAVVETLAPEVRDFDPRLALDGGPDGLAPYRIIAAEASRWLKPGGHLMVEIGYDQGQAVKELFEANGLRQVLVHQDLAGLDRVVSAHHIPQHNT